MKKAAAQKLSIFAVLTVARIAAQGSAEVSDVCAVGEDQALLQINGHMVKPPGEGCTKGNNDECDGSMVCGRFTKGKYYQCCFAEWSKQYAGVAWCANPPGTLCSEGEDKNCMPPAKCELDANSSSTYRCKVHGLDLANWMGDLAPILGQATLFDLSLPGTHDSMTYDLHNIASPDDLSFLDWIPPEASFIKALIQESAVLGNTILPLGQTQGMNIQQQLNGGIRFFDFRIQYGHETGGDSNMYWFNVHGCQTKHTAATHLGEIKKWLDTHPKEVLVFWVTGHGDDSKSFSEQFPQANLEIARSFWQKVQDVFGPLLFDEKQDGKLVSAPIAKMQESGRRVVWITMNWNEFTDSSPKAIESHGYIDNKLSHGSRVPERYNWQRQVMNDPALTTERFRILSVAADMTQPEKTPLLQMIYANLDRVTDWFDPLAAAKYLIDAHDCTSYWQVPAYDSAPNYLWCPEKHMTVMDAGLLMNFYTQRVLEDTYNSKNGTWPHALYVDALDENGTIRTGTMLINPLDGGWPLTNTAHNDNKYAYAATIIGATINRLCKTDGWKMDRDPAPESTPNERDCKMLLAQVEVEREANGYTAWDDYPQLRRLSWPCPGSGCVG